MDIAWLEDYLALRDLGSFTAAAQRRNTSQPAFSRRIQALEAWLGVTLIDRSTRPPSFTPLAMENDNEIRDLLHHFHDLRSRMRGEQKKSSRVRIAIQHSLSISLFPRLTEHLSGDDSHPVYWLHCEDRSRCIEMMFRGEADLLICYETSKIMAEVPGTLASRGALGGDSLVLAGKSALVRRIEEFAHEGRPIPFLAYPQSNFFGQVVWDRMMTDLSSLHVIETICVSGFSSALKQMVLAGMGLAWLPRSLINAEIADGSLAIFGEENFKCEMEVALYLRSANVSAAQAAAWRTLFKQQAHSMLIMHEKPII